MTNYSMAALVALGILIAGTTFLRARRSARVVAPVPVAVKQRQQNGRARLSDRG